MDEVFLIWHVHHMGDGHEDATLIGGLSESRRRGSGYQTCWLTAWFRGDAARIWDLPLSAKPGQLDRRLRIRAL